MTKHLTSRFWLCSALGWGGIALAMMTKQVEPLAVTSPFLWAIVLSVADGWWPEVEITDVGLSSARVIEGDHVDLVFTARSPRSVGWLETELQVPAALDPTSSLRSVCSLKAGVPTRLMVGLVTNRWGVTGPHWLTVVARDRFGMTETVEHIALHERVRVHPPTERLASLIPLDLTRQVTGDHRSTRRGPGSELAEVRPYRPGDPIRSIHGGLSARRGTPMVLDRHPDESADIVIFVDSVQDVGVGRDTSLRWTVTAAIALTQRHLRSMDRVGILDRGAGVRWLPPTLGRRALHTIVEALLATAVLRPRMDDQHVVPVDQVPSGATIFCISPLTSAVIRQDLLVLRHRGHEVIVIQPEIENAPAGGTSHLANRIIGVSRQVRRTNLAEQGVVVIPWNPDEPLEPTLRTMGNHLGRFRGVL